MEGPSLVSQVCAREAQHRHSDFYTTQNGGRSGLNRGTFMNYLPLASKATFDEAIVNHRYII